MNVELTESDYLMIQSALAYYGDAPESNRPRLLALDHKLQREYLAFTEERMEAISPDN